MSVYNTNNRKPQIAHTFRDLKDEVYRLFTNEYKIRKRIWDTVWRNIEMFTDVTSDIRFELEYLNGVEE